MSIKGYKKWKRGTWPSLKGKAEETRASRDGAEFRVGKTPIFDC